MSINNGGFFVGEATHLIDLNGNDSTVTIVVTSEDNSVTETYTLEITQETVASFAQKSYLKASNINAGDKFGTSLALDNNTLVIGATDEDSSAMGGQFDNSELQAGAVYVFSRETGAWVQEAILKASNAESGDLFGFSIAIDGDTLAVSAILEDANATGGESDNSADFAGAVFVFTRNGSSWTQQAYLKASNADANDLFSESIALENDTLVVGASRESSSAAGGKTNNGTPSAGAVYVFTRSNNIWTEQVYLKASNAGADDQFGTSIAIQGDTLVIGAPGERSGFVGNELDNSAIGAGAVYLFTRNGNAWIQQHYIKASNVDFNDQFSRYITFDGDTIAIGATNEASNAANAEADNNASSAGAVYVWR